MEILHQVMKGIVHVHSEQVNISKLLQYNIGNLDILISQELFHIVHVHV